MRYIQQKCVPLFENEYEPQNAETFDGEVYLTVQNTDTMHSVVYHYRVVSKNKIEFDCGFTFGNIMYLNSWSLDELDNNINSILMAASEVNGQDCGFDYIRKYFTVVEE